MSFIDRRPIPRSPEISIKTLIKWDSCLRHLNDLVMGLKGDIKLFHIAADPNGAIEKHLREFCEKELPEMAFYRVHDIEVVFEMKQPALVFGWAQSPLPWRSRLDLAFARDHMSSRDAQAGNFLLELNKVGPCGQSVTIDEMCQMIKERLR